MAEPQSWAARRNADLVLRMMLAVGVVATQVRLEQIARKAEILAWELERLFS